MGIKGYAQQCDALINPVAGNLCPGDEVYLDALTFQSTGLTLHDTFVVFDTLSRDTQVSAPCNLVTWGQFEGNIVQYAIGGPCYDGHIIIPHDSIIKNDSIFIPGNIDQIVSITFDIYLICGEISSFEFYLNGNQIGTAGPFFNINHNCLAVANPNYYPYTVTLSGASLLTYWNQGGGVGSNLLEVHVYNDPVVPGITPEELLLMGIVADIEYVPTPTFSWSPGELLADSTVEDPVITVTDEAITYVLTYDDGFGCIVEEDVMIGPTPVGIDAITEPPLTNCGYSVQCHGANDGYITIFSGGGCSPFDYFWDDGYVGRQRADLSAGVYCVTVVDNLGSYTEECIAITEPPLFEMAQYELSWYDSVNISCSGAADGFINIDPYGGCPPYTYFWSGPNGFTSTNQSPTGLEAGAYFMIATDAAGCSFTFDFELTESAPLELEGEVTDELCISNSDGMISLNIEGGTGTYSVDWAHGPSSTVLTELDNGEYQVEVTDVNGCMVSASFTMNSEQPADILIENVLEDSGPFDLYPFIFQNNTICSYVNVSEVIGNGNSEITINGLNEIVYQSNPNYFGTDTLRYIICDSQAHCDTAMILILVDDVSDTPDAQDDVAVIFEDGGCIEVYVLENDNDPDNDPLNIQSILVGAVNGTNQVNADQTSIVYCPDENYFGQEFVQYNVCDTTVPPLCDAASIVISVLSVNDPPVAENDSFQMSINSTTVNFNILENDSDVDSEVLLVTDYEQVTGLGAIVTSVEDGDLAYTIPQFTSGLDSFYYIVCDAGGACDTAIVYVQIDDDRIAPQAINDTYYTDEDMACDENFSCPFNVLINDFDANGDDLSMVIIQDPLNGTIIQSSNGNIEYTPNENFWGSDEILYEVCETNMVEPWCDTGVVYIFVNAVNDAPVAMDDSAITEPGVVIYLDPLLNDSDIDNDVLTGSILNGFGPVHGIAAFQNDGSLFYLSDPDDDFMGYESFLYSVCDDGTPELCSVAQIKLLIWSENHPPIAVADSFDALSGVAKSYDVLWNDTDVDGQTLGPQVMSAPRHGMAWEGTNSRLAYVSDEGYEGVDSFEYRVCERSPSGAVGLCSEYEWVYLKIKSIPVLEIPNAFTPNGDGKNDVFEIPGLDKFDERELVVVNRWGSRVFYAEYYENNWTGHNNFGGPLPDGTYYYLLNLGEVAGTYSGFVVLRADDSTN